MNLAGFLPDGVDDEAWSRELRAASFDVPSLSRYSIGITRPGLVFGFTAFNPAVLRSSFERMRPVLARLAGSTVAKSAQPALRKRRAGRASG